MKNLFAILGLFLSLNGFAGVEPFGPQTVRFTDVKVLESGAYELGDYNWVYLWVTDSKNKVSYVISVNGAKKNPTQASVCDDFPQNKAISAVEKFEKFEKALLAKARVGFDYTSGDPKAINGDDFNIDSVSRFILTMPET